MSTDEMARGINSARAPNSVVLPLSGSADVMQRIGAVRRDLVVKPGQHDPQGARERDVVRDHDVPLQLGDDVADQGVTVDRLGPRLDEPVAVQQRRALGFGASRFDLGFDVAAAVLDVHNECWEAQGVFGFASKIFRTCIAVD
jgi:hypothetical protein